MTKDDDRAAKARRELEKLSQEGGLSGVPRLKDRAGSVRDHFAAADADQSDRIEVVGTRIARGLALVAFIALAAWLYYRYLQ